MVKNKVLVVYPESEFLHYIGRCLDMFEIPYVSANTGVEALAIINNNTDTDITTVITAINLKDITGLTLALTIVKSRPNIKVVFTSEYNTEEIINRVKAEGFVIVEKAICVSNPEIFENIDKHKNVDDCLTLKEKARIAAKNKLKVELPYYYLRDRATVTV